MLSLPQLLVVVIIVLLIIISAVVTLYKHFFSYWKNIGLDYIEPSIPAGNALSALLGKRSFSEAFLDFYSEIKARGWKHGGVYFFGKPVYVPVNNEIIKKVLVSDFIHFPNRGFYISEKADPFSVHIFALENYRWRNVRAKLPAVYTAAKMREYVMIMKELSEILVEKIGEYAIAKKSVNTKDLLSRFTIDIINAAAFGMQSNTLKDNNETLMKESRVFIDYQFSKLNVALFLLVPRRILAALNFSLFTKSATKYFMKMFRDIRDYREKEREKEPTRRNDLLDVVMDLCDKTKKLSDFNGKGHMEPLNFNEFAAQLYAFYEASFETTSSTQSFALYELAIHPELQDRLRREINMVLDKYDGQVTYDSVNDMEYLDRVVDETLRKYPALPVLPRSCTIDYPVPGTDVTIEEGTFVVVSNLGIHYDSEYYPDPMKFDPDRFTPENKAKRPYCSYLPFGEGPRMCVGKRFGLWQSKIGLLYMIKNYKVTLSEKMELPLSFDKAGLLLKVKGDVWIDFEKI